MPRRFTAIDLARPFIDSSNGLTKKRPDIGRDIDRTLNELLIHPNLPGLHREPISCPWTDDLWSCRVNKAIRLLEEEPPGPRARAMYVGMHDSAYRWAQQYGGGGAEDIIDSRSAMPTQDEDLQCATESVLSGESALGERDNAFIQFLGPAKPGEPDLSCIPVDELCKLGVDIDTAERVRRAPANATHRGYGLDDALVDAIEALYIQWEPPASESSPLDTFAVEQPLTDNLRATDAGKNSVPLPVPLASEDAVISITAPGQFRRMIEIGLDRYLTILSDEQRALVQVDQQSLLVVRGSGGSGKTTVAIHRLRRMADGITSQPQLQSTGPRRVIYLCFNKTLADTVMQMLATLYGKQPPAHIEVYNLDLWAREYLERRAVLSGPRNTSGRAEYLRVRDDLGGFISNRIKRPHSGDMHDEVVAPRFSPQFIAEEIRDVIIGRGLDSLEEYLATDRTGRFSGLRASDRRSIWALYESWRQELAQKQDIDIAMIPGLALRYLEEDRTFTPREAVIVDEAQDLTPVSLRLATQIAGQDLKRVTIFADAAQSIYRTGFRWKQAELNPRGRQIQILNRNHRNTAQIHDAAITFLDAGDGSDEPDAYVIADRPTTDGPVPILLICSDAATELRELMDRIRTQLEDGVPPQNICVLAGTNAKVREIRRTLRERGIPVQAMNPPSRIRIMDPSVKVLTLHSAKGLDFPHVYLVGLTKDGVPGGKASDTESNVQREVFEAQRRLLYTAMIRAGRTLTMTTVAGIAHPLLGDLSEEVCRHQSINASQRNQTPTLPSFDGDVPVKRQLSGHDSNVTHSKNVGR